MTFRANCRQYKKQIDIGNNLEIMGVTEGG